MLQSTNCVILKVCMGTPSFLFLNVKDKTSTPYYNGYFQQKYLSTLIDLASSLKSPFSGGGSLVSQTSLCQSLLG